MPKKKDTIIDLPSEITGENEDEQIYPEIDSFPVKEEVVEAKVTKEEKKVEEPAKESNGVKKYICTVQHFESATATFRYGGETVTIVPKDCENYFKEL